MVTRLLSLVRPGSPADRISARDLPEAHLVGKADFPVSRRPRKRLLQPDRTLPLLHCQALVLVRLVVLIVPLSKGRRIATMVKRIISD